MAGKKKSIWECKIVAHLTLREDTNLVLVEMAKDQGVSKGEAIEQLLREHQAFNKKKDELREKGFFV